MSDEPDITSKIVSYAAIVLVSAIAGGLIGAAWNLKDYFQTRSNRTSRSRRDRATDRVAADRPQDYKFRFVLGAAIGGVVGLIGVLVPKGQGERSGS